MSVYDQYNSDEFEISNVNTLSSYLHNIPMTTEAIMRKHNIVSSVTIHNILAINFLVLTDFSSGFSL